MALLRRVRVRRSQPDHRRPGHHRHARGRRRRSASRCRPSGVIPAHQKVNFGFGKTDYQLSPGQPAVGPLLRVQELLAGEYRRRARRPPTARPISPIGWTRPRRSWSRRSAARLLNELRVQYARRHQFRTPGMSVDGPADHRERQGELRRRAASATATRSASTSTRASRRSIDNVSLIRGRHALKTRHRRAVDRRQPRHEATSSSTPSRRSTTTSRQRAARTRRAYANFQQQLRRRHAPATTRASTACSCRTTGRSRSRIKVLYGLRYDLFNVPAARPFGPNPYSQELRDRQEQLRAARRRVVVARQLGAHRRSRVDRADVRAAAARLLRQRDPEQRRSEELQRRSRAADRSGAPAFPGNLATPPPGFVLPKQSINAVDPELRERSRRG